MKKRTKTLKYLMLGVVGALAFFLILFGTYSIIFAHKIYLNQSVGGIRLASKTKEESQKELTQKTKDFLNNPIILKYRPSDGQEKVYQIKSEDVGLKYDVEGSVNIAWDYGRGGSVMENFWDQFKSLFGKRNYDLIYSINAEGIDRKIAEVASDIDIPEKDFEIIYKDSHFTLSDDRQEGRRIDQNKIKSRIGANFSNIKEEEIVLNTDVFKPQITENKAKESLAKANEILKAGDLVLEFQEQQFRADSDTIGGLIKSNSKGDSLELILNEDRAKTFVEAVAKSIDAEPKNAILAIKDGQAIIATPAVLGKKLDQVQTRVDLGNSLFARVTGTTVKADPGRISLKVEVTKPEVADDAITTLGIKELIGSGTTDFKKSPSNRIHNIQTGAAAINGVLLKPGEIFSTLKRLGSIDASGGYLEELVIKENKTTPEFGGGLCQVSSTLFRAALNAGLKIVERQNHKYRVSYYEPPVGMDATIYDPSPDFKFMNNYSNYILIQSYIDGTKITFDFYGTKDGRQVTLSEPAVFDITEPEAPIVVETDTLPPGERKLTEKAHQGASAKFDYKVVRGSDVLQEKSFLSKYVAWPEKWLVGKGAAPAPAVSCSDAAQNGDETGIDCGGSCPNACPIPQ